MLFNDIDNYIKYLEAEGYVVIPPVKGDIKTPKDLTKYFFRKVRNIYGIDYAFINWRLETQYAKTFIQQLSVEGNVKDSYAIAKAKDIIDTVFHHIEEYNQYFNIDTLKLFIMESTNWILEKAERDLKATGFYEFGYNPNELDTIEKEYQDFLESRNANNLASKLTEDLNE